jgi:isoquinoline 1-oxidoreductase beta subunit
VGRTNAFARRFIAPPGASCAISPFFRREVVAAGVAAGAGLVIGFYLPNGGSANKKEVFSPNAYLRITTDNKITIVCARSEMGQVSCT